MAASLKFTLHSYGEHELQRLGTWELDEDEAGNGTGTGGVRSQSASVNAYWIIFIHGGAWRDPTNTHKDFIPAIDKLLASESSPLAAIRGFASIDYRLSSPAQAQAQAQAQAHVPDLVRHPDHIRDVRRALDFMQSKYSINDRYILVGHSVGATLAFQTLMGSQAAGEPTRALQVPLPTLIIGIAGIYELYDFSHRHGDYYINFVSEALGADQSKWNDAAPVCFKASYKSAWPEGRAILAYSSEDSLVDGAIETMNMAHCLERHGIPVELDICKGEHDVAWKEGEDIAVLIIKALNQLRYSN